VKCGYTVEIKAFVRLYWNMNYLCEIQTKLQNVVTMKSKCSNL